MLFPAIKIGRQEIQTVAIKAYNSGVPLAIAETLGYHLDNFKRWIRGYQQERSQNFHVFERERQTTFNFG